MMENSVTKYVDLPSIFPNYQCTIHFRRVDFAQPGHVLQVAAAVAHLKGVPLKQVVCGNPVFRP